MIKLSEISTRAPEGAKKKDYRKKTREYVERIGKLHHILHAQKKYALLIILQGMDASGKDGAVKNVFKDCYRNGFGLYSFKKPTEEEFEHDFLWRVHRQCPRKGDLKIFNRSHYEDILIQRVHKWIDEERVQKRMDAINAFEELLVFDNNTILLKFYLHISYEQQAVELQQRLDEPKKYWKHNPGDWKEREFWDEYMRCYEAVLNQSKIPWHIVPVDQRWYRDFAIAKAIVEALENLDLEYPPLKK